MHDETLKRHFLHRLEKLTAQQKQQLAEKLAVSTDNAKAKLVAAVTLHDSQPIKQQTLQDFAQQRLPEHFVPHLWKQVKNLPRTSIGKVNRKGIQNFCWQELEPSSVEDFDIFDNDNYVAPTNETEALLAQIWSDVLGCGDVSIHDEFIEVGGDSLLSIRILARINKAGLSIATEDFFEYPTIAGQAKAILKAIKNNYELGSTKGKFPLLPIQNWLFERIKNDTQHWNQTLLLSVEESLTFNALERAFQKLLSQHDVLRSAFKQSNEGQWQQEYLPLDTTLPIEYVDCANEFEQSLAEIVEQHTKQLNQSMDLSKGNLACLTFFDTQSGTNNQLVIAIHHLIVDAESWRILLEDLQSYWSSFAQDLIPVTPRKTTSFKHWAEKVKKYGQSEELTKEIPYWQNQRNQVRLPTDFAALPHENTEASSAVITKSLNSHQTQALLKVLPQKYDIEIRDALIYALVTTLNKWTGHNEIVIDIEGHGRERLFDNIDISRTVGWFTTVFPVLFRIEDKAELCQTLLEIKETLRSIPKNGFGHGLLRDNVSHSKLKQQSYSEVCFNYLGQINNGNNSLGDLIKPLSTNIGAPRSPHCLRAFYIEINTRIEHEQLHMQWSYSQALNQTESIELLASEFNQALVNLLEQEESEAITTEALDRFDLAGLDADDLDAITKALSDDS